MKYQVVAPIMLGGKPASNDDDDNNFVAYVPGDVVEITVPADKDGDVLAVRDDGLDQYISSASLVPMVPDEATEAEWLGNVHDYVYEGDC